MDDRRMPNGRLRALLVEAGWTGGDLARAVNHIAMETGLRLEYRRASVAQWLSGGCPRDPVPDLVIEALSRALTRQITLADAGFSQARALGERVEVTVESQLVDLGGIAGPTRREVLRHSVYRLSALIVPGLFDESVAVSRNPRVTGPAMRVGSIEVDSATAVLRLFSEAERSFGAGLVRGPLVDYLAGTIAPWLRVRADTEELRQRFLAVATELTYLCGFMCFDDELHGAAQRYYLTALRLSADAGDPVGYAITLRSLSAQARILGHYRQAARLAETAVDTAATRAPARIRAFLLGQVAVAAAAEGDHQRAVTELLSAERVLDATTSTPAVVGAYHHASLAHQRAAVLVCLGDRPGAISALQESIRHRPAGEHRSRAITQARLAELQLDCGRIEEAVGTWSGFLDTYPMIRSGRAHTALVTLRARMRPHQKVPAVRTLLHRATSLRG